MKRALIIVLVFVAALLSVRVIAQLGQTTPTIHLDAGAHTITQRIYCDGDRVATIDTYLDGVFVMTTTMPMPAPVELKVTP